MDKTFKTQMISEKKVIWVPTLIPVYALSGKPGFNASVIEHILKDHYENIRQAFSMGILLAPGSDGGSYCVPHGQGTLKEYDLLKDLAKDESLFNDRIKTAGEAVKIRFKRA